jgi:carboxymethylenebutenolidase
MDLHVWTPDQPPHAAVLVIQEIFGVGPYIRAVAQRLADAGYPGRGPGHLLAVRAELGGRSLTGRPGGIVREGPATRLPEGRRRLHRRTRASARSAGHRQRAGCRRILSGGTLAWSVAINAEPSCCVSYYGSGVPSMMDMIDQVSCPTLFHFGNDDPYIPNEGVDRVAAALAGTRGSFSTSRTPAMRSTTTRATCSTTKRRPTRRGPRPWRSCRRTSPHEGTGSPARASPRRRLVTHIDRVPVDVDVADQAVAGLRRCARWQRLGDHRSHTRRRLS